MACTFDLPQVGRAAAGALCVAAADCAWLAAASLFQLYHPYVRRENIDLRAVGAGLVAYALLASTFVSCFTCDSGRSAALAGGQVGLYGFATFNITVLATHGPFSKPRDAQYKASAAICDTAYGIVATALLATLQHHI